MLANQSIALTEIVLHRAVMPVQHSFDDIAYVLEGELAAEVSGLVAVAKPGDVLIIEAGNLGRYFTESTARFLNIHCRRKDARSRLAADVYGTR